MFRALLLDDNPVMLESLEAAAAEAGLTSAAEWELLSAQTQEQAAAFLVEPIDLAVVDIALRGKLDEDGIGFIRCLLERNPDCKVIAFTANRNDESLRRALAAGAVDFVNRQWANVNGLWLLTHRIRMWRSFVEQHVHS